MSDAAITFTSNPKRLNDDELLRLGTGIDAAILYDSVADELTF